MNGARLTPDGNLFTRKKTKQQVRVMLSINYLFKVLKVADKSSKAFQSSEMPYSEMSTEQKTIISIQDP